MNDTSVYNFKQISNQKLEELIKKEVEIKKRLDELPKELLYTLKSNSAVKYYSRSFGTDTKRTFLNSQEDSEKIKQLEEKAYLEKMAKAVRVEIESFQKILRSLEGIQDLDNVFLSIPEERRHLIQPFDLSVKDKEILKRFGVAGKRKSFDDSSYRTLMGEKVRSKSELIIADRLSHYKIPYMYEPSTLVVLETVVWHPDFLALNKRTGAQYYWEHFGMLDNETYCNNFQFKLECYAEAGIYVGEKLIITTESTNHPLNTDYLDRVINHYLI